MPVAAQTNRNVLALAPGIVASVRASDRERPWSGFAYALVPYKHPGFSLTLKFLMQHCPCVEVMNRCHPSQWVQVLELVEMRSTGGSRLPGSRGRLPLTELNIGDNLK